MIAHKFEYPNAETPPFHLHVPLSLGLGPVSKWITICVRILYHSLWRIVHRSHRNIQCPRQEQRKLYTGLSIFSSPPSCWHPRDLPITGDRTKRYRYGTSTIWLPLMLTQGSCYELDRFQNIDEFSGVRMTKSQKKSWPDGVEVISTASVSQDGKQSVLGWGRKDHGTTAAQRTLKEREDSGGGE